MKKVLFVLFLSLTSVLTSVLTSALNAAPPKVSSVVIGTGATRSRVDTLLITIDQVVSVPLNSVIVTNRDEDVTVGYKTFSIVNNFQTNTTSISMTFMGASVIFESLQNDNYELKLEADLIKNQANESLDGDGNGTGGDDYILGDAQEDNFYRHYGDADGDGDVDGTDFAVHFIPAYGSTSTSPNYRRDLDFDGDGDIDGTDYAVYFLPAFGTTRVWIP